ncbi:MAG TPA: fibrillarin-like rRNA/tRNA 2'-O-methyltransferase [Nitrososphaerales archaeon]|nr:fibrillarin-like rRNA/tRNA 2'-O-methyltransferase [Nitrososphaerales archaeon]
MTSNVLVMEGGRGGGGRRAGRRGAFTRNLVPGNRVYDEELLRIQGSEYRAWDPYRSKLAGAILKGELDPDIIRAGDKVLYLGASTGTTASHVSDIVGSEGLVVGVEMSARVGREFLEKVAKARENVIPYISDARETERFGEFGKMDVVYCDIAQRDQTEIAIANAKRHLKKGGRLLLVVKARSIDQLKEPKLVFKEEAQKLRDAGFAVESVIDLHPFDKDHALVSAKMP